MNRSQVLILTEAGDSHAAIVHATLAAKSIPAKIYSQTACIDRSDLTFSVSSTFNAFFDIADTRILPIDVQTVWNRRFPTAYVYPEDINPADKLHLAREATAFLDGLRAALSGSYCVNPAHARRNASKLAQLKAAQDLAFKIPDTLVSNNPTEIRRFLHRHSSVCVKPLTSSIWVTEDGAAITRTTLIEKQDNLDDEILRLVPSIYQEYIKKQWEIRVTSFGSYFAATRIRFHQDEQKVDWRTDLSYLNNLDKVDVPDFVSKFISAIMLKLGLVFGCFDFVVDSMGSWVFLEVNEAGQFLWQEEYCPQTVLLEPFCEFLRDGPKWAGFDSSKASLELNFQAVSSNIRSIEEYHILLNEPQARPDDGVAGVET